MPTPCKPLSEQLHTPHTTNKSRAMQAAMMTTTTASAFVPRGATRALRRASNSTHHQSEHDKNVGAAVHRRRFNVATHAALVEPATKVSFADALDGLSCVGAGVREKKIAIVNVKAGVAFTPGWCQLMVTLIGRADIDKKQRRYERLAATSPLC